MERTYGSKYIAGASTVEIAKLIRVDIKQAIRDGRLPAGKYSVTCQSFSGGSSMDVTLKALEVPSLLSEGFKAGGYDWLRDAGPSLGADDRLEYPSKYSVEVNNAIKVVENIVAAYNHDWSDSMTDHFDVKFYDHVRVDEKSFVEAPKPSPAPEAPQAAFLNWAGV